MQRLSDVVRMNRLAAIKRRLYPERLRRLQILNGLLIRATIELDAEAAVRASEMLDSPLEGAVGSG